MIVARAFANQNVGVFGLARSGLASVRSLKAGGARVYAWDDNEAARATPRATRAPSIVPFARMAVGQDQGAGALARRTADPSQAARHRAQAPATPARR